jgi:23S rRNA pseudouridine1911/1915/1917 synthase
MALASLIRKKEMMMIGKTMMGKIWSKCVNIRLSILIKASLIKIMDDYSTITFTNEQPGRLDQIVSSYLEKPRNQIEQLIKEHGIVVDKRVIRKSGLKLKGGEYLEIMLPAARQTEVQVVDFDLPVLYEDDDILVVNKPCGLVVHPAPSVKGATLVDWLKKRGVSLSTLSGEERHGIVHRIDKETTGALIVAKHNEAHVRLSEQLEDKSMGRLYLALIDCPLKEDTVVEKSILRHPHNRLKMATNESGRWAKSAFAKIASSHDEREELIAAKLYTGRTHQIRVHLESIGRHILGDSLYGYRGKRAMRVMLHAYILYFKHPSTGEVVSVQAPLMEDFQTLLDARYKIETSEIKEKVERAFVSA